MKAVVVSDNEYVSLAEEIKSCHTERVFAAREEILLLHWETGKALADFLSNHPETSTSLLIKNLEKLGAAKETTLYESLRFFETYPKFNDIDKLGHGKNISWNKIRQALAAPKEKKDETIICKHCPQHCHAK